MKGIIASAALCGAVSASLYGESNLNHSCVLRELASLVCYLKSS
jgi:hypothetical protein